MFGAPSSSAAGHQLFVGAGVHLLFFLVLLKRGHQVVKRGHQVVKRGQLILESCRKLSEVVNQVVKRRHQVV